jgi:hypothetical protein
MRENSQPVSEVIDIDLALGNQNTNFLSALGLRPTLAVIKYGPETSARSNDFENASATKRMVIPEAGPKSGPGFGFKHTVPKYRSFLRRSRFASQKKDPLF